MKQYLKQRLQELEQQHPDAMVLLLDAEGRYLYVNGRCRDVLGYTSKEIIGRHALEFAATEDIPHAELTLQDAVLNSESVVVRIHVKTKNGELRPVRGGALRINDPDTDDLFIGGWVSKD